MNKMKKRIFSLSNFFFLGIVIFFIFKQAPTISNNLNTEGKKLEPKEYTIINSVGGTGKVTFPLENKKYIVIFWAIGCGPCTLEMKRLEHSVNDGKIPRGAIFAINPFEEKTQIKNFLDKHPYPFQFIDAADIGQHLEINATPTTMLIENGSIVSVSSGMSILGIYTAEKFLK
jgi:thiol-disulfide isomerase/thioredoxin